MHYMGGPVCCPLCNTPGTAKGVLADGAGGAVQSNGWARTLKVEVVTFLATRAWGHRPMRVFFDHAVSKIKRIKNFVPKKA